MLWADRSADEITARFAGKVARGEPLVVRDEKTLSGRVHVGSMRGVAVHGIITHVLRERGVAVRFLYEFNDLDPMDDIPSYLDESQYRQYLMRPLCDVPSPVAGSDNFAEYFGAEFAGVIERAGFFPEVYRASELYRRGAMDRYIHLALARRSDIRKLYASVAGSEKPDDWFPVSIVAPVCQGGAPRIVGYDGTQLSWESAEGERGMLAPEGGAVKLVWKVEWAAKFAALGVDVEGAGKDHTTKGGARDVASHIAREVFGIEPPYDVPYEFFLVGGKKMSSSKGRGSSAKEVSDLLPPHLFRLALIGREPKRAIEFNPDGDTIPLLFDEYDRLAAKAWSGAGDDDARLFHLLHPEAPSARRFEHFLPRFTQVAFLVQMPHLDFFAECERLKGAPLNAEDRAECEERAAYAREWLAVCAPEAYRYTLAEDEVPVAARELSPAQRAAVRELVRAMEALPDFDGQTLHTALHEVRKQAGIEPKELFQAIYRAFLGRDSGPKAGWFLSVLGREFVLMRLRDVAVE